MCVGECGSSIGIAALHRFRNCGMFLHRLGSPVGQRELQAHESVALLVQALIHVEGLGSCRGSVEGEMELQVGLAQRGHVALFEGLRESIGRRSSHGVIRRGTVRHRSTDEVGLDQRAQFEELERVIRRELGDHRAAVRHEGDQPFGLEPLERLPQWNTAHPKLCGQGLLPERLPGPQGTIEDPLPDGPGGGIGEGAAREDGHDWIQYASKQQEARSEK